MTLLPTQQPSSVENEMALLLPSTKQYLRWRWVEEYNRTWSGVGWLDRSLVSSSTKRCGRCHTSLSSTSSSSLPKLHFVGPAGYWWPELHLTCCCCNAGRGERRCCHLLGMQVAACRSLRTSALLLPMTSLSSLLPRPETVGFFPRRSPPGGYSARVKGLDTQARALES
jgi:hypothetical protein